ncbi:hypothetical protein C2S51_021868 [Perilla frutescens var. frutescens]|nr:hypothetical protein C2S51_021868 [Perilla frutescens var. frutescens]
MDVKEFKRMEGEEISPVKKTMNGVLTGLLLGEIMGIGAAVALHCVPRRGQFPELIRALKTVGIIGALGAAIADLYTGTEQLMQKQRMKRDYINYAVGGFVSGSLVIGFHGKSIPLGMIAGGATVAIAAILNIRCVIEESSSSRNWRDPQRGRRRDWLGLRQANLSTLLWRELHREFWRDQAPAPRHAFTPFSGASYSATWTEPVSGPDALFCVPYLLSSL